MKRTTLPTDAGAIREEVRRRYADVAHGAGGCGDNCCGRSTPTESVSRAMGYTDEELRAVPPGADLGVGCGNPTALAEIRCGETVLDLGSGAGIDCFLAARAVGERGRVIGVDMTDAMLEAARRNAEQGGLSNVEFRKGLIEELPVDDDSIDLVVSNCVINLSPQKEKVFAEAFRVLKPGGRLLVSDIVLDRELPPDVATDLSAYVGCVAGAVKRDDYLRLVGDAGFGEVEVLSEASFGEAIGDGSPGLEAAAKDLGIDPARAAGLARAVVSIKLRAVKA